MGFTKKVVEGMVAELTTERDTVAKRKSELVSVIRSKRHEINSAKAELRKLDVTETEVASQLELAQEVLDSFEENSPSESE